MKMALLFFLCVSATFLTSARTSAEAWVAPPRPRALLPIPAAVDQRRTVSLKTTTSWSNLQATSAAVAGGENTEDGIRGGASASSGGGTATIPTAVFNLVKSIVGAGVLSLPYGVAAFGNHPSALIPGLALIAISGCISAYTFGLIGRICQRTKTDSYSDAWDATVGTSTSWLIAFSCFIDCFFGILSYSMILADTMSNLAASSGVVVPRTNALLGVTGLVLLPLCLLKNLSSLAPFSLVGIGGVFFTAAVMAMRYLSKSYQVGGPFFASQLTRPIFGTAGASAALSFKSSILAAMLSTSYIAHFNSPTFLSSLKDNTMARFHQVIAYSFGTAIFLFGAITSFGFLTFGGASNGLILNNYATTDVLASISRIAIAVSITCSYPLIFLGARNGLLDLFKVKQRTNENLFLDKVTVGLLALVTLVASQVRDLGLVAAVGGATFGTALVFIYPAIMFLKSQTTPTWERFPAAAVGCLGVALSVIGTVLSLQGAV